MNTRPKPATPRAGRRFRLTSVRACRRELAAVYAEARDGAGGIDWQGAARAASILQTISRLLEGDELERRIGALEQRLDAEAERQHEAKVRSNGHGISNEVRA